MPRCLGDRRLTSNIVFMDTVGVIAKLIKITIRKLKHPAFEWKYLFPSYHAYFVQKFEFKFKFQTVRSHHTLSKLSYEPGFHFWTTYMHTFGRYSCLSAVFTRLRGSFRWLNAFLLRKRTFKMYEKMFFFTYVKYYLLWFKKKKHLWMHITVKTSPSTADRQTSIL